MMVIVVRRPDGKYFQGYGYGGPGHPVPYWTERIWEAQPYKTMSGARKAADRLGGWIGAADTGDRMQIPEKWLGWLVPAPGGWRPVQVNPWDFDLLDYTGNNSPIGWVDTEKLVGDGQAEE